MKGLGNLSVGKPWVLIIVVATTIAVFLATWATWDTTASAETVGFSIVEDFETGGVPPEWSSGNTLQISMTPSGEKFLGRTVTVTGGFINETVSLSLDGLPCHSEATVAFDLYAIQSWDGNEPGLPNSGPDIFNVTVAGGPTLLHTTFANFGDFEQSYPGPFIGSHSFEGFSGGPDNPKHTGAASFNTLGYEFPGGTNMDSTYSLSFNFDHTSNSLQVDFSAINVGLLGANDESWGLDNVSVETDECEKSGKGGGKP